jgi:hypothetical protein
MSNKITKYGCTILIVLILCISLPFVWLETYIWQHCLFPPSGRNVEVVVSACDAPRLYSISPDGKYILYLANLDGKSQPLLMDTTTGDERSAFAIGLFWLSNILFLDEAFPPHTRVADLSDESRTSLQWVQDIEGTTMQLADGSEIYSPEVVKWFQDAQQVYYISTRRWAIALSPDLIHPENNYVLANKTYDDTNSILKFLKENQISYREVGYPNNGSDLVSHNGRFVMPFLGPDGFYTTGGTRIGPFYDFVRGDHLCCLAYGWAYDDSGIYVQGDSVGGSGMFPFPPKAQPILKLDLPQEYLTPAARQALNVYQNHARVEMMIKVLVLILLLLAGLWFFWWRRRAKRETVQ